MECDGCDGCGKNYPEIKQIYMCKCFLVGFCTPECFEKSKHELVCEHELDSELIDGAWDRVRGKAAITDFSVVLSKYAEIMLSFVKNYYKNVASPDVEKLNELTNSIRLLDQTRQDQLRAGLNVWNQHLVNALNAAFDQDIETSQASLDKAKKLESAVINIFKAENRLSLRQTGKDIERAWEKYANALRRAIILASSQTATEANFMEAARWGVITGGVLSGKGYVNEKFELIEGPLSRVRGKSNFGVLLAQYTADLGKVALATENSDRESASALKSLTDIANQVKDSQRKGELRALLEAWHRKNIAAINAMLNGNESEAELNLDSVKTASNTVIAIFKSENRLSLRQKGKDIENAWNAYLQGLREAILAIKKTDMGRAQRKFTDAESLAVSVGRVLGGGKTTM